jgi:hypothetical protein
MPAAIPPPTEKDAPLYGEIVEEFLGNEWHTTYESYSLPNELREDPEPFKARSRRWALAIAAEEGAAKLAISYCLKAGRMERSHIRITRQRPLPIKMPRLFKSESPAD